MAYLKQYLQGTVRLQQVVMDPEQIHTHVDWLTASHMKLLPHVQYYDHLATMLNAMDYSEDDLLEVGVTTISPLDSDVDVEMKAVHLQKLCAEWSVG